METKNESLILALGPIPPTQTLIKPTHQCDQWTGTAWVLDQAALKARAMADARQQKDALLHQATDHINILLDAVALDNQQADLQQLAAYKHYRVALMRIDPDTAPEIDWPEWPQ
ncbi:phage tail protein [Yersinia mollaretii]|nr:phage tail protein [Yersinia mollaretii]